MSQVINFLFKLENIRKKNKLIKIIYNIEMGRHFIQTERERQSKRKRERKKTKRGREIKNKLLNKNKNPFMFLHTDRQRSIRRIGYKKISERV